MKRKLLLFILIFLSFVSFVSALDQLMTFQGDALLNNNELNASNLTVEIFKDAAGTSCIYNHTYNESINNGRFDVLLGNESPDLTLDWGKIYYIHVYVDGTQVTNTVQSFMNGIQSVYYMNSSRISAQSNNSLATGAFSYAFGLGNNATANYAVVCGGQNNEAKTSSHAAIVGGLDNSATGQYSFVGGGVWNNASGDYSFVGGGGSGVGGEFNIANETSSAIVGGSANNARAAHSFIGGGYFNAVGPASDYSFVGGGQGNQITADNVYSAIVGGYINIIEGSYSFIGGGNANNVSSENSTICGGAENNVPGGGSFVGGGQNNLAGAIGGTGNFYATVGGGLGNNASSAYSFVGGGKNNLAILDSYATIVSGDSSIVRGQHGFIGSGFSNKISGDRSAIVTGYANNITGLESFIGTGEYNNITGWWSVIDTGTRNYISGNYSFIPTGDNVTISGNNSMAFGRDINVPNASFVVFYNNENPGYMRINNNDYSNGSILIIGETGSATGGGAHLTDNGLWTDASSREVKEDFRDLDTKEILDKVMTLDIKNYKYKVGSPARHISPFAEDIYYTFNIGDKPQYLSPLDVAGVALVAIQQLKKDNDALTQRIDNLEQRLTQLEQNYEP